MLTSNRVQRPALRIYSGQHNARLQPLAARNARIEHDARIEGAPSVGCKPSLDGTAEPKYPS
jgi:hypothetical protein